MRVPSLFAAVALTGLIVACGPDDFLPNATVTNQVDTVTLGGLLTNPNLDIPSAYSIESGTIRTWSFSDFDFAYDIDSVAGPAFYPAEVTGIRAPTASNPGLKSVDTPFDSIARADRNGYITDALIPIDSGDVFMGRSALRGSCSVPKYAKLEVLGIDSVARTVTFRVVVDNNCGYRDLEDGVIPEN